MTQTTTPETTVTLDDGIQVRADDGRVTLDETWSPYASGTVTIPLDGVDLSTLDIKTDHRAQITLTDLNLPDPTPRLLDLALRGRTIDHKTRTIELDLASDESFLFDARRLASTPNTGARAFESSLRGICDWALGQVPGVLRNLEPNPTAVSTGSVAPYGSRFSWARTWILTGAETAPLPFGTLARFTSAESGTVGGRGVDSYGNLDLPSPGTTGIWTEGPQVTPGDTITISRYVRMGNLSDTPWIEQRRNLFTYPQPASVGLVTDGYRWGTHTAGTGTVTLDAEGWARVDAGTGTSIGMRSSNFGAAAGFIEPGEYVLSLDLEASAGQAIPAIQYWTYQNGGTTVQGDVLVNPQIDDDGRVFYPFTVNAPAVRAAFFLRGPKSAADAWFRVRRSQLESGTAPTAYFDGSTDSDGYPERTRWLGAVDASASVVETQAPVRYFVGARFHDGAGGWVAGSTNSEWFDAASPSAWTNPRLTITVPPGAAGVSITVRPDTVSVTNGTFIDVTGLMTVVSDRAVEWREQSLLSGPNDADMTAQWDATNLLLNPTAAVTADNWFAAGGCGIARNAGAGVSGAGFIRATSTGATAFVYPTAYPTSQPAAPGDMYTASVYVRSNSGTRSAALALRFFGPNDAVLTDKYSTAVNVAAGWTRLTVTAVAPAGTAGVAPLVRVAGLASGNTFDLDQAMLTEGPLVMDYFDGNTVGTSNYTYAWDGPVNGSASLRVATPERLPELFDWKPGQALWDFLRPFLESAGLRLFCDELRDWRIIDPATYSVIDTVVLFSTSDTTEGNLTDATDSASRDRDDWATGVLVTFRWRDQTGREREDYDIAGTPGKVVTFDRDTPPLKGAAATILTRLQSRGASQDATAVGGFNARPAAYALVDLADTPSQVGAVARVSFDIGTGLVDVTTRDMADIE